MESFINRCWYQPGGAGLVWRLAMGPLSLVYRALMSIRRWAYGRGLLTATRLPVPVIVIGNLTVGGAGKTPLTLALVAWLRQAGYRPGIISRGYGGQATAPQAVVPDCDPAWCGDEPVLMARRSGVPVWIGRRRAEAGRGLLAQHPEVDVLLADDGLQHLALARDLEIVVVDARRGLGNGALLPAGPLREPRGRLAQVDAVVINGAGGFAWPGGYPMTVGGRRFRNLADPGQGLDAGALAARAGTAPLHALAGIGHPQRFFDTLAALGVQAVPHGFPDHHAYQPSDLPAGPLVMTEKDAVKVAPLLGAQGRRDGWYLEIDASVDGGLKDLILSRMNPLSQNHGPQTA